MPDPINKPWTITYKQESPTLKLTSKQQKIQDSKPKTRHPYRLKDNEKRVTIKAKTGNHQIVAKKGVNIDNLDPRLQNMLGEIYMDLGILPEDSEDYFDLVLTSGSDSHDKGDHPKGLAVDVRINQKFHGKVGSDNAYTNSPSYKYFNSGKGKEIINKYGVSFLDPDHGTAPHFHFKFGKSTHNHGGHEQASTAQTQQPLSPKYDGYVINQKLQDKVDFVYETNNMLSEENKKLKDEQEKTKQTAIAKSKLYKKQQQKKFIEEIGKVDWAVEQKKDQEQFKLPQLIQNPTLGKEQRAFGGLPSISQIPEEFLGI